MFSSVSVSGLLPAFELWRSTVTLKLCAGCAGLNKSSGSEY